MLNISWRFLLDQTAQESYVKVAAAYEEIIMLR